MRFSPEHLDAFARLSGDVNPLHVDALYAGRTSFGEQVVYGVLGTLVAISTWARGRALRLRRLRCTFRRPLLLDVDYDLTVRDEPSRTTLRWCSGGAPHCDIVLTAEPAADEEAPSVTGDFVPRTVARDDGGALPEELEYDFCDREVTATLEALSIDPRALPLDQVRTLCGASYIVGMEVPGRQALFSNLDVTFPAQASPREGAYFVDLRSEHDERFGRVRLRGATRTGATFDLAAFVRPRPIDLTIDEIAARHPRTGAHRGKRVVVTGSSRGFGAALAKAFALDGANVVVHCREQRGSAAVVVEEVRRFAEAHLVEADLSSNEGAARFAARVLETGAAPDVLVVNATPPITPVGACELRSTELTSFVTRSLAIAHGACRELVPHMKKGALVVVISSVYVRERPERFAHYVAAKCAIEGLVGVMAREHPEVRFLVVRPPRMLTDQTNTNGRDAALASPADIALELLARLQTDADVVEL
jgi:NAD(P)-dependent dehydrogenase (short-subunit alcohol dehydrogenase family)